MESSSSFSSNYTGTTAPNVTTIPIPTVICPFPYRSNFPNDTITTTNPCSITYAEYLGSANTLVNIIFAIIIPSWTAINATQMIRLIRIKGWRPITFQHSLFASSLAWAIAGCARIPDPQGWATIHSIAYIQMMLILQNIFVMWCCFLITMSWIIIMKSIARKATVLNQMRTAIARFQSVLMLAYGGLLLAAGIVQIVVQPYWIGWVFAYSATAMTILFFVTYGAHQGFSISSTLNKTAAQFEALSIRQAVVSHAWSSSPPISPKSGPMPVNVTPLVLPTTATTDTDTVVTSPKSPISPKSPTSPKSPSDSASMTSSSPRVHRMFSGTVHVARKIRISSMSLTTPVTATTASSPSSSSLSAAYAIRRQLIAGIIVGVSIVAYQCYAIKRLVTYKPDLDTNPFPPPENFMDVMSAYCIDIGSTIIILVALYSYRDLSSSTSPPDDVMSHNVKSHTHGISRKKTKARVHVYVKTTEPIYEIADTSTNDEHKMQTLTTRATATATIEETGTETDTESGMDVPSTAP